MSNEKLCSKRKVIIPVLDKTGCMRYEENFLPCIQKKCASWREYINGEGICALTDIAESFTMLLDSIDNLAEGIREMRYDLSEEIRRMRS